MKERHVRSIVKGTTWRIFGTLTTFTITYLFTGSISTSLKVSVLEFISKIAIYYVHERVWNNISWGISHKTKKLKKIRFSNP